MMFLVTIPFAIFTFGCLALDAGRVDLPAHWAYALGFWLGAGTIYTLLMRKSPALVHERFRPPKGRDRDRATRLIALPLMIAHYALAGADAGRFGWSHVPVPVQLAGFAFVAGSLALVGWTLLSNPYASTAVRIQDERDHRVLSTGPYALVRHPMYLGVLLFGLGSGPALGSWWAGLLLLPLLAVFVRRTLKEDRMLHAELKGYAEYAGKVRSRVVPGLF